MNQYKVIYDGVFLGQVQAENESEARLAGMHEYEPLDEDGFGEWETDKLSVAPE